MAFPLWSCHVIHMRFNDRFLNVSESVEMKPENKHYKTLHGVRSRILCSQGLRVIACTNSSTEEIGLKKPKEWKKWMERFECYHMAAGLDEKDDKFQINTMVYAMGGNANGILKSFHLSERSLT